MSSLVSLLCNISEISGFYSCALLSLKLTQKLHSLSFHTYRDVECSGTMTDN